MAVALRDGSPFDQIREVEPIMRASKATMVTSATGGSKATKLARFDLIPPDFLRALAEHYGRRGGDGTPETYKYTERNWERGFNWSLSYSALMRHLLAFQRGEFLDPESGAPHIIAAAWHCAALYTFSTIASYEAFNDLRAPSCEPTYD